MIPWTGITDFIAEKYDQIFIILNRLCMQNVIIE